MQRTWTIPAWIASHSYFIGTEKARTIITNSRWGTHLILEELSSDMWSKLPDKFTLESLKVPLAEVDTAGNNAQYRHVLDEMDDYLFLNGRKFLTEILEKKIQERINTAEQTKEAKQCPRCKKNASPQTNSEDADDEQQSHQDFPPSTPLLKVSTKQRRFNSKNLVVSPSLTRPSAI